MGYNPTGAQVTVEENINIGLKTAWDLWLAIFESLHAIYFNINAL